MASITRKFSCPELEQPSRSEDLACSAHRHLVNNLTGYGNVLNDDHTAALLDVNRLYARLALGEQRGRWAVPLDTGMGKTQSVLAFCATLYQRGFSSVSILICQSKVEALCDLKRQLLAVGASEDAIGLMHNYKYDPEAVDPQGRPLDGYASLPSTNNPSGHQILLVTHQRIRGQKLDQFNIFKGRSRSLCIWDESLIASDVQFLLLKDLRADTASWSVHVEDHLNCQPVLRYLNDCVSRLQGALEETKAGSPNVIVELLSLIEDERKTYIEIIKSHGPDEGLAKARLIQLLDMVKTPVRVVHSKDEGIVQYTITVPPELDRVVILDASWYIRKLERLDSSITVIDSPNVKAGLKRYDDVVIHQLFASSGRTSVAKEAKAVAWTAREVAEVIHRDVPRDQGVVIFTFKARTKDDPVARFRQELERAGVDLEAMVEVTDCGGRVQHRQRINILTWGMHEGLNDYSYCKNIFLVGVLRQRAINLMAATIGQINDLTAAISDTELSEVIATEQAHVVFQALGRGSCRMVNKGHAQPMRAWLIHPYLDLQNILDQIMMGVQWLEWVPLDDSMCQEAVIHRGALRIRLALIGLPDDILSISCSKLKAVAGLEEMKTRTFTHARQRAEAGLSGWHLDMRTFHRRSWCL
jgi:hypothetical protein